MPYGSHAPQQPGWDPRNAPAPGADWAHARGPQNAPLAPSPRISGQMILLFVIGFVCLAIFVTGVVLFATTNF